MHEAWNWIQQSPLGTATWIDAIDVGLLATAIYTLLHMLRGTRAVQSLIGLLLLLVAYLAANLFGLSTMHWVLDNLFVYAVLGLIILFQEDIRRVLAQAGGKVFAGASQRSIADAQLMEEIIKALFALAGRRIGALVALERSASLDALCEGAHPIDGTVTTEILQALFHPTSPVHDGAVVVSHGRISRAGVFLPISLSKTLPKIYGTRHRAAIGLTERTDAICLLVSEERGTVAVVSEGRVEPVVDSNDLRQKLQEVLGTAPVPTEEVAPA